MKTRSLTLEHFLYLLIFILALGLRFVRLGATPLADGEAVWALQALQVAGKTGPSGLPAAIGAQPAYVLLTGLVFFLLGSGDTLARLLPALVGSALVVLPLMFRRQLGRQAALILALGLAVDPGLVALSRLAGGPMLALGFGLLAAGAWFAGWKRVAGALAALALLGGSQFFAGLLGLAFAWSAARGLGLFQDGNPFGGLGPLNPPAESPWGRAPLSFAVTLLLAGTLLFRVPQGIGGLAASLPVYLAGWAQPSGVAVGWLFVALIVYQPLAVVFGMGGIWRGWRTRDPLQMFLALWLLAALLLVVVYPGRQVEDLAWALVPLWALAARELARWLRADMLADRAAWVLVAVIGVLAASIWLNLTGLTTGDPSTPVFRLRLLVIGGGMVLMVLTTLLVGLGWSVESARFGLVVGVWAMLGFYLFAASARAAAPRFSVAQQDLWQPGPRAGHAPLLLATLQALGDWDRGRPDTVEATVTMDAPAMRWALRGIRGVEFREALPAGAAPLVVITPKDQPGLALAEAYRGQDFVWTVQPAWETMRPHDWLKWAIFREAPTTTGQVILWARTDAFPGGSLPAGAVPSFETPSDYIPEEVIEDRQPPLK